MSYLNVNMLREFKVGLTRLKGLDSAHLLKGLHTNTKNYMHIIQTIYTYNISVYINAAMAVVSYYWDVQHTCLALNNNINMPHKWWTDTQTHIYSHHSCTNYMQNSPKETTGAGFTSRMSYIHFSQSIAPSPLPNTTTTTTATTAKAGMSPLPGCR